MIQGLSISHSSLIFSYTEDDDSMSANDKINKIRNFDEQAESHGAVRKTLWQLVKFSMVSCLCGITQFTVLNICVNIPAIQSLYAVPFHWFVFNYPVSSNGLGYFIAFNIANICAQIVEFTGNRKTTFKADNSVTLTLILFMLFSCGIICLAAWLSPFLNRMVLSWGIGPRLSANISSVMMGTIQFLLYFPFDKLIMRKKKIQTSDDEDVCEKSL